MACAKLQKLEFTLSVVIALAAGFAGGWLLASRQRVSHQDQLREAFQALAATTLKSTTDEFLLVADGKVQAFDGDLHDYSRWLVDFRARQEPVSDGDAAVDKTDRKAQRQAVGEAPAA